MTERKIIITKLIATHVVMLPAFLIITVIVRNYEFLLLGIDQTILFILFLAGYWEFFGLHFKRTFLVLCQIFILVFLSESVISGKVSFPNITGLFIFLVIELYLLALLVRILIVIYRNYNEKLEIDFPFRNGCYLITDGGNSKVSRLMNYHFHSRIHKKKRTNFSMLYATDVVKIDNGNMKFLATKNENYPIFSEPVCSPMEGTVVQVVNDIADNHPYSGNYPYNTGNTVVIQKNQYYFLLGHLKMGSISAKVGDEVNRNDRLGEAGNSGMSERPHLHIQLMKSDDADYWKGTGINIQYQGKNLFKNRRIRR